MVIVMGFELKVEEPTVNVYDLEGKPMKQSNLPPVFKTLLRLDLIRRAFISFLTSRIQPQGRDLMAGKRTTAESWGVGHGVARVPRVKGSRYPEASSGALAPMTVGGRRTHPPRVEKIVAERINRKERLLAICSAIAATANGRLVARRGHVVDRIPQIPLVVSDDFQGLGRSADVRKVFISLGLIDDVERCKEGRKVKAGKGKRRGRRLHKPKGPLLVIAEDKGIVKASRNFPGVDVVKVKDINIGLLAPGGTPGRLTVWTESALKELSTKFSR